jgi:hypothetical protein
VSAASGGQTVAKTLVEQARETQSEWTIGSPGFSHAELATLFCERMNLARSAARFVFRNDPELIRKVTSNYERQRRAKARRARQEGDHAGAAADTGAAEGGQ